MRNSFTRHKNARQIEDPAGELGHSGLSVSAIEPHCKVPARIVAGEAPALLALWVRTDHFFAAW